LHKAGSGKNTLCNSADNSATNFYVSTHPIEMDIKINNNILLTPGTLYNVILHELGHVMGLSHSDTLGMMNYSIQTVIFENSAGSQKVYIEDTELWWSQDDMHGIARSYYMVKKRYCIGEIPSGDMDMFLRCLNSPWDV
jgi:hypothetical protein